MISGIEDVCTDASASAASMLSCDYKLLVQLPLTMRGIRHRVKPHPHPHSHTHPMTELEPNDRFAFSIGHMKDVTTSRHMPVGLPLVARGA